MVSLHLGYECWQVYKKNNQIVFTFAILRPFVCDSFRFNSAISDEKTGEKKWNKAGVSSMIHSARPTVSPVANKFEICFVLKSADERTTYAKTMIPSGRDFGLAEWIKKAWQIGIFSYWLCFANLQVFRTERVMIILLFLAKEWPV